jgi:hypothetical protein
MRFIIVFFSCGLLLIAAFGHGLRSSHPHPHLQRRSVHHARAHHRAVKKRRRTSHGACVRQCAHRCSRTVHVGGIISSSKVVSQRVVGTKRRYRRYNHGTCVRKCAHRCPRGRRARSSRRVKPLSVKKA